MAYIGGLVLFSWFLLMILLYTTVIKRNIEGNRRDERCLLWVNDPLKTVESSWLFPIPAAFQRHTTPNF